ncbi:carbon-nitrogen hydrolase family protein [Kocuria sp. M1N1S27]|uniref:carbon-nitrogen hydrolase family protein n=1 Tax=Kocuria kalidii TaxID=3376283 RepID=UPI0037884526
MRIALAQLQSGEDVGTNLSTIAGLVEDAAGRGAEMVVLPEYATYLKKAVDGTFPQVAEPLDGPVCSELARLAAVHGVAVVAGVLETCDVPGRAHNTLVVHGADGRQLASYRKIHLFDAQGHAESRFIEAATTAEPVVFDVGGLRFGLLTCYDLRFPELARTLADAGAQVLLSCAAWVPGEHKLRQWQALSAARAIENGVYVLGSCQAEPISIGHSLVVDPMGATVAELGTGPSCAVVAVLPERITAVRQRFPVATQRRLPAPE